MWPGSSGPEVYTGNEIKTKFLIKTMKKLIVLLAVVVASVSVASAQNYDHGVGLRLGYGGALDYKWNFSERNSWEFNLSFPAFAGFSATAAYQWNWPLGVQRANGEGFNAYVGPAAGLGYLGLSGYKGLFIGIGGHGGVEYKFRIPLAIGIDYKPMFTYVMSNADKGLYAPGLFDFGLAIRYAF